MTFNRKTISSIALLAVLAFLIIVSFLADDKEDYFKQVELPTSNQIINPLDHMNYYDTILAVAMDGIGLRGATVVLNGLDDAAKNQFDGELKAHVRLINGTYYLFVGSLSRYEAIQVISHEVVHIKQYDTRELVVENGLIFWQGDEYTLDEDYLRRPWERDAFDKQNTIETIVMNTLY